MKTKNELQNYIGRAMGQVGLQRHEMIIAIAEKNKVKVRAVYGWINSEDPLNYGRIEGAVEAILNEKKGA